ncbi:phosphoribosylaminoimidazolesuccinocarboxamide synthase [Kribbella deserti]|uniref:Phosphoribosylaminoimidazole-succinocarboxamide synthase n=1 Tax=Kribbella deserti TaxID=1926257 RepID=A0ABV6QSH2_9ACTN
MKHLHTGKVRDLYSDRDGELLLVASDRVSVYDVVLPTPVPGKGKILNQLSLWWFEQLADVVPNHVISATDVPAAFAGRAIRCRQVDVIQVECIARGYLAGGGWASYRETGLVSGVQLPPGLVEGDRIPAGPIFTPTSKVAPEVGHDEQITFAEVAELTGPELAAKLRDTTLALYNRASAIAEKRGVILADTKFEFGLDAEGELIVADEVCTPDSSRYWRADEWQPGHALPSMDKQYLRDWSSAVEGWDKTAPGPEIPAEVVAELKRRYVAMYEQLTETPWQE